MLKQRSFRQLVCLQTMNVKNIFEGSFLFSNITVFLKHNLFYSKYTRAREVLAYSQFRKLNLKSNQDQVHNTLNTGLISAWYSTHTCIYNGSEPNLQSSLTVERYSSKINLATLHNSNKIYLHSKSKHFKKQHWIFLANF